jgi:uncharacterized protein
MIPPPYLTERPGNICIAVKAQPRARSNEIVGISGAELKIRVTAPPVDSAANEALIVFLAGVLGCPRRSVTLVRGASSTHKLFCVEGLSMEQAIMALGRDSAVDGKGG